MRRVKFRVWNESLKQWLDPLNCHLRGDGTLQFFHDKKLHDAAPHYKIVFSTGRYDKNRKEIYEDDILMVKRFKCASCRIIEKLVVSVWRSAGGGQVNINNGHSVFPEFYNYIEGCIDTEIIGNRFENPELLGEAHV